jgi:hypothetical protein
VAINAAPNEDMFGVYIRKVNFHLQILFLPRDQNSNAKSRRPFITDQRKSSLSTSI